MIENKRFWVISILLLIFIPFVSSATIQPERHLNLQFTDSSGNILTGTSAFDFRISENADCSSPIYTNTTTLTTDTNGVISYYLQGVPNPSTNTNRYLCIYRDSVFQSNFSIAPSDYAIYAMNISAHGILDDSNINLPLHNITANWHQGLFNWSVTPSSSIYLTFNGASLSFSEAQLNQTIISLGLAQGFNSTFNATYAQFAYNQTINDGSFNATYAQFAYNQTLVQSVLGSGIYITISPTTGQGNVVVGLNETNLNNTISNLGNAVGFNSTFNATYAQFAYNQSGGSFNATYDSFAYNQTDAVFTMPLLNNTIALYGVSVGFNSTFNATYDQFAYNQSGGSFNSTYATFAYNQTLIQSITGSFYIVVSTPQGSPIISLNETNLNNTIANYGVLIGFNSTFNSTYASFAYNQTSAVFTMSLLNNTIANYGNLVGFNSTFNASYAQFLYNQTLVQSVAGSGIYVVVDPTQGNVIVSLNETNLNLTISDLGNGVGFNSTFNSTYNNLLNQMCPNGQFVNGTLSNGTVICQTPSTTISAVAPYLNASGSTIQFNETKLNQTISNLGVRIGFNNTFNSTYSSFAYNQTSAVFTMILLNNTIAQYGNLIGFNSTFNATYAQFAYNQTIVGSVIGIAPYINTTTSAGVVSVNFNETKLNQTISDLGNMIGFNSTFNSTYASFAYNQTIISSVVGLAPYINTSIASGVVTVEFNETKLNQTISDLGVRIGFNSSQNPFDQPLNTTNNVIFRNMTATNISSTDWIRGKKAKFDDTVGGAAVFPITSLEITNTALGLFGVQLIRMTGGSGLLTVGAIANGLYIVPDAGLNSQFILGNSTFTQNWVFNHNNPTRTLEIYAQDTFASTLLPGYGIKLFNNLTAQNISAERITALSGNITNNFGVGGNFSNKGIATVQFLNATNEVCVIGGTCLNKTIPVFTTNLVRNFSIIYFSNTTQRWESLNKTPTQDQQLTFCNNGGLQWISLSGGVCPL